MNMPSVYQAAELINPLALIAMLAIIGVCIWILARIRKAFAAIGRVCDGIEEGGNE